MSDDEWTTPSKAPRPLSEVLGKVLRKMKVSDETTALGLFSHWREIVGDPIADHVLPKRLEKRRLVVEVDDADRRDAGLGVGEGGRSVALENAEGGDRVSSFRRY